MRFSLIDQIVDLEPGERIRATKCVSLAEEYLADHFPRFPVLPGVLMLEAMTQASAWLIRASDDFAHSIVILKETKNVKYASFLAPGQTLCVDAVITKQDERDTTLKVEGTVEGEPRVSGRIVLERFNLADANPDKADMDEIVRNELRKQFSLLYRPVAAPTA